MKKYLIRTLLISLFIGFVSYATIVTKRNEEINLLNQNSQIGNVNISPQDESGSLSLEPVNDNLPIKTVYTASKPIIEPTITLPVLPLAQKPNPSVEESPIVIEQPLKTYPEDEDRYSQSEEQEENDD